MATTVQTLELRWHFPHDIDSGAHGVLSGKDTDRPAPVVSVHWHPHEHKLLTSGFDGSAKIWSFDKDAELSASIRHHSTMFLHERSSCNCARWSPDGKTIAAGYNSGEVVLWRKVADKGPESAADGAVETNLNKAKPAGPTAQNAWSYEFNLESWSASKVFRDYGETEVYTVCFSSDGRLLASGSQEGHFVLHDLENGYHKLRVDHRHVGPVQGITWDPLGTYFATIGADRKCFVYGVVRPEGKPLNVHIHDTISRAEQGYWLFRGQDATQFYRHASFSPDGLILAIPCGWFNSSGKGSEAKIVNEVVEDDAMADVVVDDRKPSSQFHHCAYLFVRHVFQRPYRALCISGDSPVIGAIFSPRIYRAGAGTAWGPQAYTMAIAVFSIEIVTIFTTASETPVVQLCDMHLAPITGVAWCADGKHLAISSDDGACTLASIGAGLEPIDEREVPDDAPVLRKIFADNRAKIAQAQLTAEIETPQPPKVTTCIPVRRKEAPKPPAQPVIVQPA